MSSCQDVINRAARKLNVIPLGAALGLAESNNALVVLQSIYLELVGWGAFGRENDLMTCGDWKALPNQRIRMNKESSKVTIPDSIPAWWPDWWSPGWGYDQYYTWPIWPATKQCVAPKDLSVVTIVDPNGGTANTFLYDAYVGTWTQLDGLALSTEAPLSRRWFEPLANVLAGRLSPDYGQDIPQTLALAIRNGMQAMTSRYSDTSLPVVSEYC